MKYEIDDRILGVKNNLRLTMRERGKIVQRREVHNIWLTTGRQWLAQHIAYSSYSPRTIENAMCPRYMGFGMGGTRQLAIGTTQAVPLVTAYPGTNVQTDVDPEVTNLERPVRISGGTTTYPGNTGTDVWLKQIQVPPIHDIPTRTRYVCTLLETDISYSPYVIVPLSEAGLFLDSSSSLYPNTYNNAPIAYDTFETLTKTTKFQLEVDWTLVC